MSVDLYKAEADRLYEHLSRKHGVKLKKSSILESVAILHGHPDWNTLVAVTRDQPDLLATSPAPAPLSVAFVPPKPNTCPDSDMPAPFRGRVEKARRAQIEGAQSQDSLEKIGIPPSVTDAWLTSLLASTGGIFFVCGPTGSGKTTAMFATACELKRRGIRVAHIELVEEYPRIEGNLYYSQAELSSVLLFAKKLKSEGVSVVFIGDSDRYHMHAEMLASLGFRVVTGMHASRVRARLKDVGWADHVIERTVRGALHIRLTYNPESNQRLPLAHLEVHDTSGDTRSYGAPLELLTGLFGSTLFESELSYLPEFFAKAAQTGAFEFEVRLVPKRRS